MYSIASCDADIHSADKEPGAFPIHQADLEWEFLLDCAAVPFNDALLRRVSTLTREDLNWAALASLAERNGLIPILCERLSHISHRIPAEALANFKHASEQNTRQTLWLTHLLFTISDLFQKRGIFALPYKGPTLAHALYGNVSMRQYSDLDILVHPADVPIAKAVLQDAGFTLALQLTSREEAAYIASGYEYTFHGVKSPNLIELQWRILPRFYAIDFDVEKLFRRAQTLPLGERSLTTMGNEDLVLVLCVHAAKHAWSKLSWSRDIAELAQAPNLDWDEVSREARRLGIARIVALSFWIANEILGTSSPVPIQRLIQQDSAVPRVGAQLCGSMRRGQDPDVQSMAYFRFWTRLRERKLDRLRFGLRLAITPSVSEWSVVQLPAPMFPLYRIIRIWRLGSRLLWRE